MSAAASSIGNSKDLAKKISRVLFLSNIKVKSHWDVLYNPSLKNMAAVRVLKQFPSKPNIVEITFPRLQAKGGAKVDHRMRKRTLMKALYSVNDQMQGRLLGAAIGPGATEDGKLLFCEVKADYELDGFVRMLYDAEKKGSPKFSLETQESALERKKEADDNHLLSLWVGSSSSPFDS